MADKFTSQIRLTKAFRVITEVPTQKFPNPPVQLPVADFTYSPTTGDFPLTVTFTNTSTKKPLAFVWDFNGDGTIDSSLPNPTFTFQNAGSFSPRLIASNQAGSNTKIGAPIVITTPPAVGANFIADVTLGAMPLGVQFTDTSSNAPTSWLWDFGDGQTSTLQNPTHTYGYPASYNVSLTATNATSSDTRVKNAYIQVTSVAPTADFTWAPSNGTAPLQVTFTDTSTDPTYGGSALREWDFSNDGLVDSTAVNPVYTYTVPGIYDVKLRLTNDGGSNVMIKSGIVNVALPLSAVSFTATPLTGAYPLSVTFTDTTQGVVNSRLWDFGDGQTSTDESPVHVYALAGQYTVTLTDTNAGGSNSSTITNMITATNSPPTAVFAGSPLSGSIPLSVTFTNSSAGVNNSYAWDYNNDGNPDSTAFAPTVSFTTPGVYSIRLTATNDGGTSSELKTGYITVTNIAPIADFGASPTVGPIGMTVNFNDASTGVVTSRLWDFGDGTTSTLTNPTHVYSAHGDFTVTLTATNDGGSNTKIKTNFVSTKYPIQVADFTGTPVTGAVPLLVTFTNTTTGTPGTWVWDFGDGTPVSSAFQPTHSYTSPGNYTVTLTAINDGGSHTKTRTSYIAPTLAIPVANFTASPTTGNVPQTVTFTDTSTGTRTAWLWEFGDGTTSTLQNPTKTYTVAGSYTVKLTATNSSGSNQKTSTNMLTFTSLNYNYMDPANKSASMTLTNNNLTLASASDGIVVGKYPFVVTGNPGDVGNVYWEMLINARGSGIWFGLVKAGQPLTAGSYPGQRLDDYSFSSNGMANTGGGSSPADFFQPTWLAQGITGMGFNILRNGGYSASQLRGPGNDSGVGGAWFGGGAIPPGTYYPCVRLTGGANVTMNFGPTMTIRSYGTWTSGS